MDPIVGSAPSIDALRAQIRHLASFDAPGNPNAPTILLQGETGTGKGLVARVLHDAGGRARGPFVEVNCAAIPETMLEAELFGFEGGAFTDAKRAKPGLFEAAAGGSLFLDEIDSLPPVLQGKLLRAIEDKTVRRIGAVTARRLDVKLIVATQRDLRELVAGGTFRADLYHRLAVLVIEIPPLRARADDVVLLAEHFLARHAGAHGLQPKRLGATARGWLSGCAWPGNVRELSHLMERVTLLAPEAEVDLATLAAAARPRDERRRPRSRPRPPRRTARRHASARRSRARGATWWGRRVCSVSGATRSATACGATASSGRRSTTSRAPGEPPRARKAAGALPEDVQPSWDQRPVAVLAIDVVLPDSALEPWTVARRWEQQIEACIAGFGGVFLACSPSRLSAAFGVPRALEQLPQRAVQAALAIQRLVAEDSVRPELRMAVHVGTLRFDARSPQAVERVLPLGDTLALAERLLGHADAGEILVSALVARRVDAFCELRARELRIGESGGRECLGRARPAGACRGGRRCAPDTLHRARARARGPTRELRDRGRGPRARGLRRGRGRHRQVPPCSQSSDSISAPSRTAGSRDAAPPYATTTAFLPVVDALRRFFAIDDHDDDARASEKIARALARARSRPDLDGSVRASRPRRGVRRRRRSTGLDSASRRSETFRALKAVTAGPRGARAVGHPRRGPALDRPRVRGVPHLHRRCGAGDSDATHLLAPARLPASVRRPQLPRARRPARALRGGGGGALGRDARHGRRTAPRCRR